MELHFPNIQTQIDSIKNIEFENGDYFITKHSNIPSVHIVFHIVCGPEEFNSRSPTIQGYRSLLKLCHYCSVTHLTVPIAFDSKGLDLATMTKRVECVFKQTKGICNELSRDIRVEQVPRQIIFLIDQGETSKDIFNLSSGILSEVFRIT
jgi:hypothetical protein